MDRTIQVIPKHYFQQIFTIDCPVCQKRILLRVEKVTAVRCVECKTKLKLQGTT